MAQLGFDFGVQQRRLIRVTPARLATFNDCPRRYRMAYLDRPPPQRTGPWAHSTLGAVVHNALRALFDLPPDRRTPARAAALVGEQWSDSGFLDERQAARYRERAKQWVAEYVDRHDLGGDPVGVERWVSAPASGQGPQGPPSMIVEGRADRIDERDGELVVVDYKTGRRPPDSYDARGAQALAMYAVAAARTLRRPCRLVELHHVPTGTVAAAEHTPESLARHLRRAEETATDLQTATDTLAAGGAPDEVFPARTGPHCSWCDFRPSCPAGQQAAPAARSWDLLASQEPADERDTRHPAEQDVAGTEPRGGQPAAERGGGHPADRADTSSR
ncbi:RecB family exonuclease [Amycolatopsis arida]|uniref:RecB family exonuclease n=1 Tax=Amycolatopsis arida TaxID=587909 RepID=A0A1I5WG07_9PSEU|nr:RecB family exonuclease [Amycolatopsis arida]SFQ18336.1 RecB family exonuclease [Amycolatopsis arida]